MGRLRLGLCVLVAACGSSDPAGVDGGPTSGKIQLDLELPPAGDLRPDGMTTVAVAVTTPDGVETVTTTPLTGMSFSAGEATVGTPVTIGVELHDNTNRIVGFGENPTPVTPDATDQTVRLDVRKPFVYMAASGPIATIDTTRDPSDAKYQGSLNASGALAIPIDGTEIAVISGSSLQRVTTADHQPTGSAIDLRVAMLDAAAVPGKRQVAVATQSSVVLVDVDSGALTVLAVPVKPDRIAVGGGTAYVLSSRAVPPMGTGTCGGSSTVTAVPLDGSATSTVVSGQPLADIAAAGAAVYGANPCAGKVSRLDGGDPALSMTLPGASNVAVEGVRLFAAGTIASTATTGAQVELASAQLDGSDQQSVKLTPKSEPMTYDDDDKHELELDIAADTYVVLDMAVLPGAQSVAMIARMDSQRDARGDISGPVVPPMKATVYDFLLADTKTGATRRIREKCTLVVTPDGAEFPDWSCKTAASDEVPAGGENIPTAISALYGGR